MEISSRPASRWFISDYRIACPKRIIEMSKASGIVPSLRSSEWSVVWLSGRTDVAITCRRFTVNAVGLLAEKLN